MYDPTPARGLLNRDELDDFKAPAHVRSNAEATLLDIRTHRRQRALRGEELALLLAMGVEVRETAPLFVAA